MTFSVRVGQIEQGNLLLNELIPSETGKVCVNIRTGQIAVLTHVDDIKFVEFCGTRNLARAFLREEKYQDREVVLDKRVKSGRRTIWHLKETLTGFPNVAKQLSVLFPCTGDEVEALVQPLLDQGFARVYLYTLANSLNLPNSLDCEARYGFSNKWLCSGSIPKDEYKFVNKLLRERKSEWRVRTSRIVTREFYGEDV